jgi:hypothetical protein
VKKPVERWEERRAEEPRDRTNQPTLADKSEKSFETERSGNYGSYRTGLN